MRTVFRYLKPRRPAIALCLLVKISATLIELALPWMLSVILDDFVPARDLERILLWGALMLGASALGLGLNVFANRLSTRISKETVQALRRDLFGRILGLSRAQEDGFTASSLISRLTSDSYHIYQLIDRMLRLGVRGPIMMLGGLAITFALEPVLTLVLLVTVPLLASVVYFVSRAGIRMFAATQEALDTLVRRAKESMAGVRVIRALSKTDYEISRFDEASYRLARREAKAALLMNATNPAVNAILNTALTLVIVVGAYRVNGGVILPGVIIAFLSYFTMILTALMMTSRLFVIISKGVASARRVTEVLEAPPDLEIQALPEKRDEAHIRFDRVRFSYNKTAPTLEDISFSLKRGQTLGIIGPTGSGKSTLLHLLLRFYDPDGGAITIDGIDLRSMPKALLHSRFGVVFQNDFLFADEVGENIRFGRDLSDEAVRRAARIAQADFIPEKEDGFGHLLAPRGANLSGGQKQRVLIARAVAAGPEILILDDSSSALDYKTDASLRHALARALPGATKIIVAQRISAIRNADRILVLDEGRILGSGSHCELMESCESYREIARIQMEEVG